MNRQIRRRIRRTADGVNIVADVNATVAANIGRSAQAGAASASTSSSHQHIEIVQRAGRTEVREFDDDGEPLPEPDS